MAARLRRCRRRPATSRRAPAPAAAPRGWSGRRPRACPVPGANAGSTESMSNVMYAGPVATRRISSTTDAIPRAFTWSMSSIVMPCSRWNSKSSSPYIGPRMPTWMNRFPSMMPFLDRAAERRAVKVLAAEILVPGVDVRVELHQRQRTVPLRERAQDRQRDRVVAADDDRPRAGIGDGADPRLDRLVALLDADRRRVDVADVGDVQPRRTARPSGSSCRSGSATTARGSRAGRACAPGR